MERSSQGHHSRVNQGRDRVELVSEHGGNFYHEDVAHHATADSGQHTEQRRRNRPSIKDIESGDSENWIDSIILPAVESAR